MRKLLAIIAVGMLLTLVACGHKETPKPEPTSTQPKAPAAEPEPVLAGEQMVEEIGGLDEDVEGLSVEGLDDLDAALADIESLDI